MGFIASVGQSVASVPSAIVNTDGIKGELLGLLGIGIIAVGLIGLFSFGSKKSGMRDLLSVAGGVLIVLMIVGMAALVGTDAGRTLVSSVFDLG